MFAQGGLFMEQNAYVPEGRNEEGTPTSISIFDSYDMNLVIISSLAAKCQDFEIRDL